MSSVQSVERAFRILDGLAGGSRKVTELADRIELPKSTVSRLLSTMHALGIVETDPDNGEYTLGAAFYALASAGLPDASVSAAAQPYLLDLAATVGEATGLSVVEGDEVLFLSDNESLADIQMRDWSGERTALHLVPSGLVMLAWSSADRVDDYLNGPLASTTESSVTDSQLIRSRLEQIRASGYALVRGEFVDDVSSAAAPVRDADGDVVAAIHIHGPSFRFLIDDTDEVVSELLATATRISAQLGWE